MNTFLIAIHDEYRELTFKINCGGGIEGLLFFIANNTKGYKKEDWFANADFTFKFFNREDFEQVANWARSYGEIT